MKKGYFQLENYENVLENIEIILNFKNAIDYLHGYCEEFSLALNQLFNYKIVLWIDYRDDISGYALLHAFNTFSHKGQKYYVDIRGVTDDIQEIKEGFDYSEAPIFNEYNKKDAIDVLKKYELSCLVDKEIFNFIKNNTSYYIIN